MRESKIRYNPSISVSENAKKNGVSEAAIRYYIKTHLLDRRYDRKQNIIDDCRKYLRKNPNATKTELQRGTGHSLSTIRQYWEFISTENELMDFDKNKAQKRQLRQSNNFYATHPSCTSDLLREETFNHSILEPFCGAGSISEILKNNGFDVLSYDIIDRGYGNTGDFFKVPFEKGKYDIISNPPYDDNLIDIIKRCIDVSKNKVALILPIRYLSGLERYEEIYSITPPSRIYVYIERICIAMNANFLKYDKAGANKEMYAWYVWDKSYEGPTELRWIHNKKI